MERYYYDLHVHSCLSPCGDDDSTPNNIAGMASLCELDIVALTDHNTCKNCPAFFAAASNYGIIPVAGMELTTSEDIHVVCLFRCLEDAMKFDGVIDSHRILIKNKPRIFGEQIIMDAEDNPIGMDEHLLTNATDISIENVFEIVNKCGGICFPAHIDKPSNSVTAILGTLPSSLPFTAFELHSADAESKYRSEHDLSGKRAVISSDAHYLTDLHDRENYVLLDAPRDDHDAVRKALLDYLGGE